MNIRLICLSELTPHERQRWNEIRAASPWFANPFFSWELVTATAAVREGVELAVLEDGDRIVGFFPYQRRSAVDAVPVSHPMSNCHGMLIEPGIAFNPATLVQQCGLQSWSFDHAPTEQTGLAEFTYFVRSSVYVDLSAGFDAYAAARKKASHRFEEAGRRCRKLRRERSDIRFEADVRDRSLLARFFDVKQRQLQQRRDVDTFSTNWTRDLLYRLFDDSTSSLRLQLSALFIGDVAAAIEVNLRQGEVVDCWSCTYDTEFARLSPGMVCRYESLRAMAESGVRKVVLGPPDMDWKVAFHSHEELLATGAIDLRPVRGWLKRHWQNSLRWAKHSSLRPLGRAAKRSLRWILERNELR